jgi:trehalose/maltose hydrolase-like predicted phosphorylase
MHFNTIHRNYFGADVLKIKSNIDILSSDENENGILINLFHLMQNYKWQLPHHFL